jgi:mRNA interferase MazF
VRGDVIRLRNDRSAEGREQRGARYAVVLQDTDFIMSTVIVAPTSTSAGHAIYRPEIIVNSITTRVMVEQMRACDYGRLGPLVDHVRADELRLIADAIRLLLDV